MQRFLLVLAATGVLACSPAEKSSRALRWPQAKEVVAIVGEKHITMEDVEARWQQIDPVGHSSAMTRMYEGRRRAIDSIVGEQLTLDVSSSLGLGTDDFVAARLSDLVTPVTENDIKAFIDAQGRSVEPSAFERTSEAVRRRLEQERRVQAREQLLTELRVGSDLDVEILLDPPRWTVALSSDDPVVGSENPLVTIVEFGDFHCPFCAHWATVLKRVVATYPRQVRLVWKDFPLSDIHPEAMETGRAARCAQEQGRFWPYHDTAFQLSAEGGLTGWTEVAELVGVESEPFAACMASNRFDKVLQAGIMLGTRLGVASTPTAFVNGRRIVGAVSYETLVSVVEEEIRLARGESR